MIFSSYPFLFIFLPIVLLGFYGLKKRSRLSVILWLIAGSLVFYAYWKPIHLVLILGSIGINYALSRWVHQKKFLILGICFNLLLLGYFKYANFFLDSVGLAPYADVVLPLGISFFTFQQLAFLIDLYRGEFERPPFWHYALCILFFPHLIAGPIVRVREFIPQFLTLSHKSISPDELGMGITLLSIGLFKKIVLADPIGQLADDYFSSAASGITLDYVSAWVGALAYTAQIYLDFSAYTEMAIGLALLFGIQLPQNFNFPYLSTNIIDFWRRWHITLSRFLRDYLYIPLGGNRNGELLRNRNLMLTMLLGGLWHGAGWQFVLWGGLHGLYLVIAHQYQKHIAFRLPALLGWLLTFLVVVIAWVFFRAENFLHAWHYLGCMFKIGHLKLLLTRANGFTSVWMMLPICAAWIALEPWLVRYRHHWIFCFWVALLGFWAVLCLGQEQKFIYFNF